MSAASSQGILRRTYCHAAPGARIDLPSDVNIEAYPIKARTLEGGSDMDRVSVRYIVSDMGAAIAFYATMLGFQVDMNPAPGFASLSKGALRLLLNEPGAGRAGQTMPDGQVPAPGGWNRFQVEVEDLAATVEQLKRAGCRFRNEIVIGRGGKQVLVEDPSGNPVELFEPA
jgi:catechol 2,3-dioxygenase-like lactoylglutathione lyase family enzyme